MLDNLQYPIKTPSQALKNALILAITAETEEKSKECLKMAKDFAKACSEETVERIKKEIEVMNFPSEKKYYRLERKEVYSQWVKAKNKKAAWDEEYSDGQDWYSEGCDSVEYNAVVVTKGEFDG